MGEDLTSADSHEQLGTGPLAIDQIMSMIKHRYPLLLIDRVLECSPGKSIYGLKNVSRGETMVTVKGAHLPRLLLVEALAQISVVLTFQTLRLQPTGSELMFFAGIDNGHFEGHVEPGDVLHLRSEIVRLRKTMGWFKATAQVDQRVVARMSMLAAIQLD